jgi:hypothetical protein
MTSITNISTATKEEKYDYATWNELGLHDVSKKHCHA